MTQNSTCVTIMRSIFMNKKTLQVALKRVQLQISHPVESSAKKKLPSREFIYINKLATL